MLSKRISRSISTLLVVFMVLSMFTVGLTVSAAADKTGLVQSINAANALVKATYTAASWADLESALDEAVDVNENSAATQSEVDAAKQALDNAMAALVRRGIHIQMDGELVAGAEKSITIDIGDPDFTGTETITLKNYRTDVDYITDGLVLRLDGIQNTPDGHSDTTDIWYDLSGNGYNVALTLNENNFWKDSAFRINFTAPVLCAMEYENPDENEPNEDINTGLLDVIRSEESTLEFLISDYDPTGSHSYKSIVYGYPSGQYHVYYAGPYNGNQQMYFKSQGTGGANERPMIMNNQINDKTSAIVLDIDGTSAWYVTEDETIVTFAASNAPVPTAVVLGGRANSEHDNIADYRAVRIYNRALTEEEIRHNSNLDQMRFFGKDNGTLGLLGSTPLDFSGTTEVELNFVNGVATTNLKVTLLPEEKLLFGVGESEAYLGGANKIELGKAIEKADKLDEQDFEPVSWAAMMDVYEDAVEIYENPAAEQEEVDQITAQLLAAIDALTTNKTALEQAINNAKSKNQNDWETPSWNYMQSVLSEAEDIFEDPDAPQWQINAITDKLNDAVNRLVPKGQVDKTDLWLKLGEADELVQEDYTQGSWSNMISKKESGQQVYDNPSATQAEVNQATTELDNAIEALVSLVDLKAAIALAETKEERDWSEASWQNMQTELNSANNIKNKADATKQEVEGATTALLNAIDELTTDKSDLEDAIDEAESKEQRDWSPATWAVLQEKLDEAEDVYDNADAKQFEIDDAEAALRDAIEGLAVDKTGLQDAIAEAESKNEEDWFADTWENLQEKLDEAEAVYNNSNAKQFEVDEAGDELRDAIEALDTYTNDLALEIIKAKMLEQEDYSEDSWDEFIIVLQNAEDVLNNPGSPQWKIDQALANLEEAVENLVPKEADKTLLQQAIDAAEELDSDDWTLGTWQALQEALDAANEVNDDEDATQEEVDEATDNLNEAIDALAIRADVNGDGEVKTLDALYVLQFISESKTPTPAQQDAADANKDGKISAQDALTILRMVSSK